MKLHMGHPLKRLVYSPPGRRFLLHELMIGLDGGRHAIVGLDDLLACLLVSLLLYLKIRPVKLLVLPLEIANLLAGEVKLSL